MPDDRFIHPKLSRSVKVSGLTDLEFRVWMQEILSADDFGVLPHSAPLIRGANDALEMRGEAEIGAAINKIVDVGLRVKFNHQGKEYSADPVWQDFQRVRRPRAPLNPCPPAEILRTFSRNTIALFREHHGQCPEDLAQVVMCDDKFVSRDHLANGSSSSLVTRSSRSKGGMGGTPIPDWSTPLDEGWPHGVPTAVLLVSLYNHLRPSELPAVTVLSEERARKARKYLGRFPQFTFWRHAFEELGQSEFLRGLRTSPGHESFRGDFDWLLTVGRDRTENVVKVAEGKYRDGQRRRNMLTPKTAGNADAVRAWIEGKA